MKFTIFFLAAASLTAHASTAVEPSLRGASRQLEGTYGKPYMGGCGYNVNACANYDRSTKTWSKCGLEAATLYCQRMGYGGKATAAPTATQTEGSSCLMEKGEPIEAGLPGPDGGAQQVFTGVTCVN